MSSLYASPYLSRFSWDLRLAGWPRVIHLAAFSLVRPYFLFLRLQFATSKTGTPPFLSSSVSMEVVITAYFAKIHWAIQASHDGLLSPLFSYDFREPASAPSTVLSSIASRSLLSSFCQTNANISTLQELNLDPKTEALAHGGHLVNLGKSDAAMRQVVYDRFSNEIRWHVQLGARLLNIQ
jgi:hypothetical protein